MILSPGGTNVCDKACERDPRKAGKHVSRYTKRPKRFRIGKKGEVALVGQHGMVIGVWRDDDQPACIGLSQCTMLRPLQGEIDQPIVNEVYAGLS